MDSEAEYDEMSVPMDNMVNGGGSDLCSEVVAEDENEVVAGYATNCLSERRSAGRIEKKTRIPCVTGGAEVDDDRPTTSYPFNTFEDPAETYWNGILESEGFLTQGDDGNLETIYDAARRHGEGVAHDQVTFEQRVPGLVKALKSPNAYDQRVVERLNRKIQQATNLLNQDAKEFKDSMEEMDSYLKLAKALVLVAIFVFITSFFM